MVLKGHIQVPASPGTVLDMIPVDMVASATCNTAATLAERNELIYHLGSSDSESAADAACRRANRSLQAATLPRKARTQAGRRGDEPAAIAAGVDSRQQNPISKLSVPLLRGVAEAASGMIGDALDKMWGCRG